jgi:thioesterase domain-containing protein/acyl carrier protein
LFNDERIGIDDDFFDLGGDSLLAAELAIKVEIEFQRIIPATALLDAPTVSTLARLLDRPEPLRPAETLVVLRPMRAAPRHPVFFCVHGLGGGVVGYQTLARALGPEQPFYALQARGLDSAGASRADTSIEDMASHYVDAIRALQPRGPYHLGGYCFGGVVAYEMARQLEAVGDEVALVAVLEGYAPNRTPGHTSRWRDWRSAARMVRTLPYWLRDYLRLERVEMQARNRRLRRVARKRLLQLAGVRVEFDAFDFMDGAAARPARIQHLITTHLAAGRQYSPASYNGRLVLFRTPHVLLRAPQHDMGWGRLASQTVDVQMIAGAHGSILEEPHVRVLAGKLAAYLPPLG